MMSSLITKTNKSRSPASQKVRTTKGKKVADKKPQRPGKITAAPKAKKAAPAKSKKPASPAKKPVAAAKKSPPKKVVKPAAPPPKKTPPATLLAVKSFEQALRLFNRHDYKGAKDAFDSILDRF